MEKSKTLQGIKPMWYGHPSPVCYIGSVMRLMEYIGEPVAEDELFALSGTGLCFPWKFASSCDEVSVIPEIPGRTFEALGYKSEHLTGEAVSDKELCLDKIRRSIENGRPVIGFGITVKMPMSCLIVGYDENGLYTRSFWPPPGAKNDSEEYFYSTDWHENCSGLLFVGDKTGERLTGAAAYAHVVDWARKFRSYNHPVIAEGMEIYVNQHAFNNMADWLLDDSQWQNPDQDGMVLAFGKTFAECKEIFLKQCGLLLFQYYRNNLYAYLKRLDADFPGVVNKSVFAAIERIVAAIPGAHTSDLWLHEAVDPALKDFSAMSDRALREKVVKYVRQLKEYDNSVQWTLFMPDFVKSQTKGFKVDNFEYRELPAMRFIGAEGEEFADVKRRIELMRKLDDMKEYKSGFDYDILFMHHYGLSVENPWHGVWGRFMKADAPVPEGFLAFDFVPRDVPAAGPPYHSRFAFATFSGYMEKMHSCEGFDSDAMYDVTRNIILGDGVCIPYPEKYWTAEVFPDGCDKYSTGYLFSIGEWDEERTLE